MGHIYTLQIILCLSEIQIKLGILSFYLLNLYHPALLRHLKYSRQPKIRFLLPPPGPSPPNLCKGAALLGPL